MLDNDTFFSEPSDNDDITLDEMREAFSRANISTEQICLDLINGYNMPHIIFNIIREGK